MGGEAEVGVVGGADGTVVVAVVGFVAIDVVVRGVIIVVIHGAQVYAAHDVVHCVHVHVRIIHHVGVVRVKKRIQQQRSRRACSIERMLVG